MLLNNFFSISHFEQGEQCIASIALNSKHSIFDGHFPQNPVVPGVCMLQMLQEIIENKLNKKLKLVTAGNIKYTAVLNPNNHPNCKMKYSSVSKENNFISVDAKLLCDELVFFSFKGQFAEVNN